MAMGAWCQDSINDGGSSASLLNRKAVAAPEDYRGKSRRFGGAFLVGALALAALQQTMRAPLVEEALSADVVSMTLRVEDCAHLQCVASTTPRLDLFVYKLVNTAIWCADKVGLGRRTEIKKRTVAKKLKRQLEIVLDPTRPENDFDFDHEEENVLVETIVGAQDLSIWAQLMPALYQLVPGSMIAKLWFTTIFPPSATYDANADYSDVFSNLMVISTSLAIGTILGFVFVRVMARFVFWLCCCGCGRCCEEWSPDKPLPSPEQPAPDDDEDDKDDKDERQQEEKRRSSQRTDRFMGMFTAPNEDPSDPSYRAVPDEEAPAAGSA